MIWSGLVWSTWHLLSHGLDKTPLMDFPFPTSGTPNGDNPFTGQTKAKRKRTVKPSNSENRTLPSPPSVPDDEEWVLPDFAGHVKKGIGTGRGKNGAWE